jgi:hypothetical protein
MLLQARAFDGAMPRCLSGPKGSLPLVDKTLSADRGGVHCGPVSHLAGSVLRIDQA